MSAVASTAADAPEMQSRPNALPIVFRWFVLVAAVNIFLVVRDKGTRHEAQYLLGSIFLWASATPFLLLALHVTGSGVLLSLVALVTFVAYGMPVFMHERIMLKSWLFTDAQVTRSLELATLGVILMIAAYFAFPARRLPFSLPRLRVNLPLEAMESRFVAVAILCSPFKIAGLYWVPPPVIAQPILILGNLALVSCSAILLLTLRGRASLTARVVALVVFIAIALADLGTSMVANTIRDTAVVGIVYFYERRRWPWRWLIVAAIALFPFLTTKHEFRRHLAHHPTADPVERVSVFVDITLQSLETGKTEVDDMQKTTLDRVNHLATFTFVSDATPNVIPYWGGETYKNALWSVVPRFIYPDKPHKQLGQDFGHRYMILDADDYETSVNFTQLSEMYANFGYYGVIGGTLILGLIYRLLTEALENRDAGDAAKLVAPLIFSPLLNVESDFSVVFGGIVYATLSYVAALLLLTVGLKRPPSSPAPAASST